MDKICLGKCGWLSGLKCSVNSCVYTEEHQREIEVEEHVDMHYKIESLQKELKETKEKNEALEKEVAIKDMALEMVCKDTAGKLCAPCKDENCVECSIEHAKKELGGE